MRKNFQQSHTRYKLYILLFFLIIGTELKPVSGDANQANLWYNTADQSIKTAFAHLSDLNADGIDVYMLIQYLNGAAEKLADSQRAIINGDYDNALLLSQEAYKISLDTMNMAGFLKQQGVGLSQRFNTGLALVILEVLIVSFVTYFGWRIVKEYYVEKLLKMKPEVNENEH
jgi:hypothetical protein